MICHQAIVVKVIAVLLVDPLKKVKKLLKVFRFLKNLATVISTAIDMVYAVICQLSGSSGHKKSLLILEGKSFWDFDSEAGKASFRNP